MVYAECQARGRVLLALLSLGGAFFLPSQAAERMLASVVGNNVDVLLVLCFANACRYLFVGNKHRPARFPTWAHAHEFD